MLIAGGLDIHEVLSALALRRQLFHSEADFQHAFAWEVHVMDPLIQVYLEAQPVSGVHLDLVFERSDLARRTVVELKYLTRAWSGEVGGQRYALKNHSAQDMRRYDVVKDINRVERVVREEEGTNGAVVVLTNDHAYWAAAHAPGVNDEAFRIGEGAVLQGRRQWLREQANRERERPIDLAGRYTTHWTEYRAGSALAVPDLRQLVVTVEQVLMG